MTTTVPPRPALDRVNRLPDSAELRRARRRKRRPSLLLIALSVLCLLLFVWPVAMLAWGTLRTSAPGQGGRWSTSGLTAALTRGPLWQAFANSIMLSGVTVVLATGLAVYFAWLVTRTRTPLRQLVTPIAVLIFAMPPLFFALSWSMLGQQPSGLIDKALHAMIGATPLNIQSWFGLIAVSVMGATAAEYLLLLGPFRALNPAVEEASQVSGAGRVATFFRIVLPALAPSILGVGILGFVFGMGVLTTPLLLGQPAGIYTLPTEIYRSIYGRTPPDYAGASAMSLLLVIVVLALVVGQARLLGRRQFTTVTGKLNRLEPADIGAWKWLGTTTIVLYGLFAMVLPLGQFVLGSLEPYFGVYKHLTLNNYRLVLNNPAATESFTTTVVVAVVAGFVATGLGVWIALVAQRSPSWLRRLPDLCVWLLWSIPGITLSLGILWAYLSVPGVKSLYGTQWIVLIALIVGSTPIASRAVAGPIGQISRELEEAARTAGASATRTTLGILVRLIAPSFLVSWFLAGIVSSGNLDIPLLLASSNNQTVPLLAYNQYNQGYLAQAAATFCLLIGAIACVLLVAAILRVLLRGRRHRKTPRTVGGVAALTPTAAIEPQPSTFSSDRRMTE